MYISVEQSHELDKIVKSTEVALRSFISDTLLQEYTNQGKFLDVLKTISISDELIYSKRISAKLRGFISGSTQTYSLLSKCKTSLDNNKFDNDVPYVSDIIELLLIFFNSHFSDKNIAKDFSSIEEFHYCCTLYHKSRNNLSHPASRPITELDANKVIYFIGNIISSLGNNYFWYYTKENIKTDIVKYKSISNNNDHYVHNLTFVASTHNSLLCRETIINSLYDSMLGSDLRQRLAGSVVLYGYGGVGKTAITTEFLYRIDRDKKDGKYSDIKYLLFYSSKDEYLRENKTTGELYIDIAKPEFSNLEELQSLICNSLNLADISKLAEHTSRGIIAIDNIENIEETEKLKIISFMKLVPREVQFIVTSRNEEACEEKIHVDEFTDDVVGLKFIEGIIESEGLNLDIKEDKAKAILRVSKGNALIILQALNIIERGVSTYDELIVSLDRMKSKNSEMIASFMYKNTFDNALKYLVNQDYPVTEVMQIISLYDERIELYSISKLVKIDISIAERICNYLLQRLILTKRGEYYEVNEFAKRFVFIKLLPDRFVLSNIKDKIKSHKERMKKKLLELDTTLKSNSALHQNVTEWQPRNYIDKIVIAELFSLYGEAIICVGKRDLHGYEKYLKDFDEHSFITNHPYLPIQKARLLIQGIHKFYKGDEKILSQVEHLYEEAIETIEYDYRYLNGSIAHASLLMVFGIFLSQQQHEYSRAIRFLEDSKKYQTNFENNMWFSTCNYLSISLEHQFKKTNDKVYKDQLYKIVREVFTSKTKLDLTRYKTKFSKYFNKKNG